MKEFASSPASPTARKYSPPVLSLLFAFAMEVLDGAVTALGQPPEYRMIAALVSVAALMFLGLALYGVHHRTRWGGWLSVGIACLTLGFSLPTLVVGNIVINGVPVDQTVISQAIGWTKMAAYTLFLILFVRERFKQASGTP